MLTWNVYFGYIYIFWFQGDVWKVLSQKYLDIHIKYLIFFSGFMLHWIFSTYFYRSHDVKVNENRFSGSRVIPRDTKKLTEVFGNLAFTSLKQDKTPVFLRSPWYLCVCGLSVSDTNYCTYWPIWICTGHCILLD